MFFKRHIERIFERWIKSVAVNLRFLIMEVLCRSGSDEVMEAATITLYPIGRPVWVTITLYPV